MGGIIYPNQLTFDSDPSILGLLEKYLGFIYLLFTDMFLKKVLLLESLCQLTNLRKVKTRIKMQKIENQKKPKENIF